MPICGGVQALTRDCASPAVYRLSSPPILRLLLVVIPPYHSGGWKVEGTPRVNGLATRTGSDNPGGYVARQHLGDADLILATSICNVKHRLSVHPSIEWEFVRQRAVRVTVLSTSAMGGTNTYDESLSALS